MKAHDVHLHQGRTQLVPFIAQLSMPQGNGE